MGWIICSPGLEDHEGFLVGLERTDNQYRYRELGVGDAHRTSLSMFQVGCSCGWRSPRFVAPLRAEWNPCCVELHDRPLEERLADYWQHEHIHRVPDVQKRALDELPSDAFYEPVGFLRTIFRYVDTNSERTEP